MPRLHSHYDNLKVARDAPSEVIRAAYKTLSQKYHPDRNPGNEEAARIMSIINASYAVLSDPSKRMQHDLWIKNQELSTEFHTEEFFNNYRKSETQPNSSPKKEAQPKPELSSNESGDAVVKHIFQFFWLYLLIGIVIFIGVNDKKKTPSSYAPTYSSPYQSNNEGSSFKQPTENPVVVPIPAPPKYVKPFFAPNGSSWPFTSGYVDGYQLLHSDGLSSVTIDNTSNSSDVFVKLVSLDDLAPTPVRHFYIPAYGSFEVKKIRSGKYDIRYKDLDSGALSRSDPFELEEITTENGKKFSVVKMTLYKVRNGNMKTHSISEADF